MNHTNFWLPDFCFFQWVSHSDETFNIKWWIEYVLTESNNLIEISWLANTVLHTLKGGLQPELVFPWTLFFIDSHDNYNFESKI